MSKDVYKLHDSTMNSLDWSLENATGLDWMEFSQTLEYETISKAVWNLVANTYTKKDEDE